MMRNEAACSALPRHLTSNRRSGSMPRPTIDITGHRFGKLVVSEFAGIDRRARWACHCDCGKTIIVYASYLRAGDTRSCGCLQREIFHDHNLQHGHARHGKRHYLYLTWVKMRERCNNPAHKFFKYYGARGIKVCERWNDFTTFLADMGERPPGHTLDRYPNKNGNYEPSNTRWATPKQQAQNRRPANIVT